MHYLIVNFKRFTVSSIKLFGGRDVDPDEYCPNPYSYPNPHEQKWIRARPSKIHPSFFLPIHLMINVQKNILRYYQFTICTVCPGSSEDPT